MAILPFAFGRLGQHSRKVDQILVSDREMDGRTDICKHTGVTAMSR